MNGDDDDDSSALHPIVSTKINFPFNFRDSFRRQSRACYTLCVRVFIILINGFTCQTVDLVVVGEQTNSSHRYTLEGTREDCGAQLFKLFPERGNF